MSARAHGSRFEGGRQRGEVKARKTNTHTHPAGGGKARGSFTAAASPPELASLALMVRVQPATTNGSADLSENKKIDVHSHTRSIWAQCLFQLPITTFALFI